MLLPLLLGAVFAASARAQLDAWRAMPEESLHSKTFSAYDGKPEETFAACDAMGRMTLPAAYAKDYDLSARDQRTFARGFGPAKRYASIKAALDDGYLPTQQPFTAGTGLALIQPDLLKDGRYIFEKPDVLTYVKKMDSAQFRLVGMIYIAGTGNKPPVVANVDFGDKSRRKDAKGQAKTVGWSYWDDMCFMIDPGKSVSVYHAGDIPHHCKGGLFYKRIWRLYYWGLVYNPAGLFAEANTVVDYLDHSQKFGPLCPKPAKK